MQITAEELKRKDLRRIIIIREVVQCKLLELWADKSLDLDGLDSKFLKKVPSKIVGFNFP